MRRTAQLESKGLVALRFVDNFGKVTETYPANPNGSANGITAVTSESGRVTIMMPHPERVFRTVSNSGTRKTGARTARGCAFSATRVNNWVKFQRPDCRPGKRERHRAFVPVAKLRQSSGLSVSNKRHINC